MYIFIANCNPVTSDQFIVPKNLVNIKQLTSAMSKSQSFLDRIQESCFLEQGISSHYVTLENLISQ